MKKLILTMWILTLALIVISMGLISASIVVGGSVSPIINIVCDPSGYTCSNNFNIINPTFNGNFVPGTTLYTSTINVVNSQLYGRDVYPTKENPTQESCHVEYYNITKRVRYYDNIMVDKTKRVCHYEYVEITKTKRVCSSVNHQRICNNVEYLSTKRERVCELESYQVSKRISLYRNEIEQKSKTICDSNIPNLPIGCLDPITGVYTNQLSLSNFKMSINNGPWQNVPYGINQMHISNANIVFKVDIPSVCSPTYDINKAIYIVN